MIDTGFDASLFPAPAENGIHSCQNETRLTSSSGNINISDVLLVAFDAEKDFSSKKGKIFCCRYKKIDYRDHWTFMKTNMKDQNYKRTKFFSD